MAQPWKIVTGESWYGPWRVRYPQHESFFDHWWNHFIGSRAE